MSSQDKSQTEKTALTRSQRSSVLSYLERNRGNRQYRHAPSAGWSTNKILRPLSKKFTAGKSELQAHWAEIVGAKWAALSRPIAIRGGKDGKTLHIEAKGPAAALMQANTGQLLGKINQFLGAGTISKLSVKHGSIKTMAAAIPTVKKQPAPQVHSTLETSTKNRLQSALDDLGDTIRRRDNN